MWCAETRTCRDTEAPAANPQADGGFVMSGVHMLTVVTGPPCVGKSTWVDTHAQPGDITIDMDRIAVALQPPGADTHDHPSYVRRVAQAARNTALNRALAIRGIHVWLIHTDPDSRDLATYRDLGAKIVTLTEPVDVLMARAADRPEWTRRIIREWHEG